MDRLRNKNLPMVTIAMIALNAAVFLVMEFGSDALSSRIITDYAMSWPRITAAKEWYRLLTACFIHFGFEHLASNMFMLGVMGDRLEKTLGRFRFAVVYLLTGIAGAGASLLFHMWTQEPVVSAGASGAIYGIVGAMFGYLMIRGGFLDGVGKRQLIVMIVFMIYTSTIGDSIDIAAHAGGLLAGFLLGLLFALSSNRRQRRAWGA
ncbi:MAG: rhomboid family intramembrane serine protease [Lachnospiraceae bacterium]|nr:rhomboid family intramembrane serine protease [Lachnospiraceae bacterium]